MLRLCHLGGKQLLIPCACKMWWLQNLSGFGNRVEGLEGFGIRFQSLGFRALPAMACGAWVPGLRLSPKSWCPSTFPMTFLQGFLLLRWWALIVGKVEAMLTPGHHAMSICLV